MFIKAISPCYLFELSKTQTFFFKMKRAKQTSEADQILG